MHELLSQYLKQKMSNFILRFVVFIAQIKQGIIIKSNKKKRKSKKFNI